MRKISIFLFGFLSMESYCHYLPTKYSEDLPTLVFCEDSRYTVLDPGFNKIIKCDDKEHPWSQGGLSIRGNSSKKFAKKQYNLDFENKINFLGLPSSNEFVLHSPYIDRSFIRNSLMYDLAKALGHPSPENKFIEMWIDDDFKGIFLLTQKISKEMVGISKINPEENNPANFFIAEISYRDKDPILRTRLNTPYKIKYPSEKKFLEWQENQSFSINRKADAIRYGIRRDINEFESHLTSDFLTEYMEIKSFVDYFILQEFSKNFDAYRRSMYFYQDNDKKIKMGPFWDFDISLGNFRLLMASKTKGWAYKRFMPFAGESFWFKKLMKSPVYKKSVITRYKELRSNGEVLSEIFLENLINEKVKILKQAALRDEMRWLGTYRITQKYITNTSEKGQNYIQHIGILKRWIGKRLKWMDQQLSEKM